MWEYPPIWGGFDDNTFYAYWIVDWEDVQVAGKCTMERKNAHILEVIDFK